MNSDKSRFLLGNAFSVFIGKTRNLKVVANIFLIAILALIVKPVFAKEITLDCHHKSGSFSVSTTYADGRIDKTKEERSVRDSMTIDLDLEKEMAYVDGAKWIEVELSKSKIIIKTGKSMENPMGGVMHSRSITIDRINLNYEDRSYIINVDRSIKRGISSVSTSDGICNLSKSKRQI
jgi:hypothetical protein